MATEVERADALHEDLRFLDALLECVTEAFCSCADAKAQSLSSLKELSGHSTELLSAAAARELDLLSTRVGSLQQMLQRLCGALLSTTASEVKSKRRFAASHRLSCVYSSRL